MPLAPVDPRVSVWSFKVSYKLSLAVSLASGLMLSTSALAADEIVLDSLVIEADISQVNLPDTFAGGQVAQGTRAGVLGNINTLETPFSTTGYTEALIREQQATSIADVLDNDPTVTTAKGFGNFQELYVIRGFPVYSDDMTYNGLYGILPRQFVAAEQVERVEVLRGSNSLLNGAAPGGSAIGGMLNLVPKRAGANDLNRITVGAQSGGEASAAVDLGRRYGDTGVRASVVKRKGDSEIESQRRDLTSLSLGVSHDSAKFRMTADMGYQDHRIDAPRPSVTPSGGEIPSAPDSDTNYAQPWTYTDEQQLFGVVRGEYYLTYNSSLWVAFGGRNGNEDNVLSNPTADVDGNLSMYRFDNVREDDVLSAEVGYNLDYMLGDTANRLTLTASQVKSQSRNAYAFSSFFDTLSSHLYNPTAADKPSADFFLGGDMNSPGVTERVDNRSVALVHQTGLMRDRLLLSAGLRHQQILTQSFNYNTGEMTGEYDDSATTPMLAAVYRIQDNLSVYGNYSEALVPGDTVPEVSAGVTLSNAGEVLDPFRSNQYELGLKAETDRVGGSVAVFSLSKPSAIVEGDKMNDNGEQVHQGLELSFYGQATNDLRVMAGATWMQSDMQKTEDGTNEGKEAIGVPTLTATINVSWAVPAVAGLSLDGRSLYTGSQYADAANDIEMDSWNRFDLGASYDMGTAGRDLTLSARVENVADNEYWSSVGGYPGSNYLVQGDPRTFMLSASVDL